MKEQCTQHGTEFLSGLKQHEQPAFRPEMCPDDLENEPERKRARLILEKVTSDHAQDITAVVDKEFAEEVAKSPPFFLSCPILDATF